ncbi:putative receptor-like protein kinase At3g47110 [Malus domestica]|uniref:putative receptor-like protein kinase At3g47110 n=1 Tax=Malus domestica TaxID=3750 RepID=UPI003975F0E8
MTTRLDAAILPRNETDRLALLDFKDRITQDPLNVMSSWNDSTDFCSWVGVTCNPSTKRVSILKLNSRELAGSIPASIGNLTYLTAINLTNNDFHGEIPQEIGRLRSLQYLNLSGNSFRGKLPANISHCMELSVLDGFAVTLNQLQGELPPNVGTTLPNLEVFYGHSNKFAGNFPSSLSNASRLSGIDFSTKVFTGTIPASFGNLKNLVKLNLAGNLLGSGKTGDLNFLSSLANCTILEVLGVSNNHFGGELPRSIDNLSTSLQILAVGGTSIHGSIPIGIGNLINLTVLGAENSFLSRNLPDEIRKLQKLGELYLSDSMFSGRIPSSIGNLTALTRLYMHQNSFEGSIPPTLANCQTLLVLNLSGNK